MTIDTRQQGDPAAAPIIHRRPIGRRLVPWLLIAPATLLVLAILVVPVGQTILGTFAAAKGLFASYQTFFGSGFHRTVIVRTLRIAAVTTLVSVFFGFLTAYVVAQSPRRIKSILIVAAVFPLLTGVVVRTFAWIVILGKRGFLNTLLTNLGLLDQPLALLYNETAVVLGMIYVFIPIMVLSLVGVLEGIEGDLVDASASLGAGRFATFRQVILPLALPGLIVGAVLVFTGSFTAFATPRLLGGDRQVVLATLLYQNAMVNFDWTTASTIAAIMVVITLAVVGVMTRVARRYNPAAA